MSGWSSVWLGVRSLLATIALPGMVAGYVPWRYYGVARVRLEWGKPLHFAGLALVVPGAALLAACIWEFARSGQGTLAPVDPPRHLVVKGLYRHVRNPMYVGVTAILIGELLLAPSRAFLGYVAIWFVAVNLFIIGYEEPVLRRQFGESYEEYTRAVHRWLPRRRSKRAVGRPPSEWPKRGAENGQ